MVSLGEYAKLAKAAITAAVCATLFIAGCNHGQSTQKAETDKVTAEFKEYRERLITLTERASKAAKTAQEDYHDLRKLAESSYQAGRDSAQLAQTVLVDDLRAGNVRLRQLWQGCVSAPAADETGATAGGADESAELRAEAAAAIVRVGDDADNQVKWLAAELLATRKLAESCGSIE